MNINIKKMGNGAIVPQCHNGDWIDLYVYGVEVKTSDLYRGDSVVYLDGFNSEGDYVYFEKGDTVMIHLGVAMELPDGYEGHLLPRSSTYKKTGLLMTNGMGVIDNAYCGDADEWCAMMYATRDGAIQLGERYHQFRVLEKCRPIRFNEVPSLQNESRGGYGSTDKK